MKVSILKIGLSNTATTGQIGQLSPYLQQSLKLLQMNNLELSNYINQELALNPFCEIQQEFEDLPPSTNEFSENCDDLTNHSEDITIAIEELNSQVKSSQQPDHQDYDPFKNAEYDEDWRTQLARQISIDMPSNLSRYVVPAVHLLNDKGYLEGGYKKLQHELKLSANTAKQCYEWLLN